MKKRIIFYKNIKYIVNYTRDAEGNPVIYHITRSSTNERVSGITQPEVYEHAIKKLGGK